ncbi:MAG: transglycosylase SLT domain-containing protein [Chloroflexi bacterium]|nr:transglycosylase SLT domain-containing protein [Chloroflexota bacterium]
MLYPFVSVPLFAGLLFFVLSRISLPDASSQSSSSQPAHQIQLAPIFAPQVLNWEPQILEWAAAFDLDPNLVATVMQIESCGDPQAVSIAGASGLFQVMPYHFAEGENHFSPKMNARRGLAYLAKALSAYDNNPALALAAYNGGINGVNRPQDEWPLETQGYYYWGSHIYADAQAGLESSSVLSEWMSKGGASLCAQAEQRLAQLP